MLAKYVAYKFRDSPEIYDSTLGTEIKNFRGIMMVYFPDGGKVLFNTGINQYGERYYSAVGNNPIT